MACKRLASRLHLLTVREVQTAAEGDHSDGGGLLLRVRGESASWVLRYTAESGRRREMGLGLARRGSPAQAGDGITGARKEAQKARELLLDGVDPIDERDRRREAAKLAESEGKALKAREHLTLARAARDYHERAVEQRLTAKHGAQWIASLENHVPASVWHAPIADFTTPMLLQALSGVRALDDKSEHVPETLQRVRQRLDAVFEDSIFHGRCLTNPAAAIKRKMHESMPKKKAGEFAALPYREVPAFMAKLRSQQGIAARCLELALLTASRTSEVLYATWSEFQVDESMWRIPAERMKSPESHTVYLSQQALDVIEHQRGLDASIVFPSPMLTGQPMSNMAMLAVLDRMGVRERTTVHGLCRATFSTWANETGAARPDVIEACLAHREADKVKAAYNRAQFADERRALMVAWGVFLVSQCDGVNVVPFKAASA
jgi:integrase